jgi:hypothetical protein
MENINFETVGGVSDSFEELLLKNFQSHLSAIQFLIKELHNEEPHVLVLRINGLNFLDGGARPGSHEALVCRSITLTDDVAIFIACY